MRAWLLLLAVLATFQNIVQVASTEDDNTTKLFISAILPHTEKAESFTSTTTAEAALPVNNNLNKSTATASMSRFLYENIVSDNSEVISNSEKIFKNNILLEIKNSDEVPSNKMLNNVSERTENLLDNANSIENNKENIFNNNLVNIINSKKETYEVAKEIEAIAAKTANDFQNTQHKSIEIHLREATSKSSKETTLNALPSTTATISSTTPTASVTSSSISAYASTSLSTESPIVDASTLSHVVTGNNDDSDYDDVAMESNSLDASDTKKKVLPDPSILVEFETNLLTLLNVKRPPIVDRSKIVIPEAMKQLYEQITGQDLNSVHLPKPGLLTKSANTVRSFEHQESKIDDRFPHHHRIRLYFDIRSIPPEELLKAAELQLSRDAISHIALNPRLANRTRYQVLVYDITRVGIKGKREPSYLLLDNKTVRLNSTEKISLDVQPAVVRWLETPNKNYGLLVEVRTMRSLKPAPHHHVRLRRSINEPQDVWELKKPLLLTYLDDGRHKSRSIRDVSKRSKRTGHSRRQHRKKHNEEICRRHSLYVDFADVGWSDWIVAPPGYDAYYCHGRCPFPLADHLNSTNHAVVQTLVNNINPGKAPKACCVPTQLEGISMLYLNDQNTVVLKNYQDMTVVGCGCR